jgi:hypothetical protein
MKQTSFFILFCALSLTALSDNWPHWRGPTYNGVSVEKGLPVEWSEGKNVAWKLELPGGSSATPIVWGKKIFFMREHGRGKSVDSKGGRLAGKGYQ